VSVEIQTGGVRAAFLTLEDATAAVVALQQEGFTAEDMTVFSPIPTSEVEVHFDRPPSPVRKMTLIGGFLGTCTGFALTYWTFFAWPLHVGGKPLSSFPVTVVIMFELTVLLGGLFTLAAILLFSRLPALTVKPGYHPRFSEDLFGVFVHVGEGTRRDTAVSVLEEMGGREVEHATD